MNIETQSTILIVDDTPEDLSVLREMLRPQYRVLVATSGEGCLRAARAQPEPDLILLGVMMPVMDGYEVLAGLRANPHTRDIPVIFLTAQTDAEDEEFGLNLGAADYIQKPIKPAVLLARVQTQLVVKQAREFLKGQNEYLEAEIARRMAENELTQQLSIRALAHLTETRDPETGRHTLRTQGYGADEPAIEAGLPRLTEITPAEKMLARLASIPGFNVARGISSLRGNSARFLDLLGRFLSAHADDMTLLAQNLDADDQATARLRAHTIKGTAATLGADHLAELAGNLEKILREERSTPLRSVDVRAETDAVSREISAIAAVLSSASMTDEAVHGDEGIAPADQEAVKKIVQELIVLLEQSDTAALGLFEAHAALLRNALGAEFDQVAQRIRQFDFAKVLQSLQAWA